MSNSKFRLTGENINLARVAQMILGPCTNVLRDVLRREISPSNLETKVRAYIAKTKKPLINQHQETLVYGHDYSKFDVTLLYLLLRNVCSIQPHSNKWGNNPSHGDGSVSANIERIRLIRNKYGHNSERSISDIDFKIEYKYIKGIVRELENYLGSSTKYQDEVKELKTYPIDLAQSEKNIKELLDLQEKIKDISESAAAESMKEASMNKSPSVQLDPARMDVDEKASNIGSFKREVLSRVLTESACFVPLSDDGNHPYRYSMQRTEKYVLFGAMNREEREEREDEEVLVLSDANFLPRYKYHRFLLDWFVEGLPQPLASKLKSNFQDCSIIIGGRLSDNDKEKLFGDATTIKTGPFINQPTGSNIYLK